MARKSDIIFRTAPRSQPVGNWDGVKELAAAVIMLAVRDIKNSSAQQKRKNSAITFLSSRTKSPQKGESMFEFCCELCGLNYDCVKNILSQERGSKR